MKHFYSIKAKILLAIACIFFSMFFLMSTIAWFLFNGTEFNYGDDFREHIYSNAAQAYAAIALSKYDSGFNADLLNEMNCYFGIVDGIVTEKTDLNDDGIYFYRNFSGVSVPKEEECYIQTYRIGKNTHFKSVGKCNFIDMIVPRYYRCIGTANFIGMVNYDIEVIGYDILDGRVYAYANNKLYPLNIKYELGDSYSDISADEILNLDGAYKQAWDTGKFSMGDNTEYEPISKTAPGVNLYLTADDETRGVGVISGDYVADLSQLHNTLKDTMNNDSSYEMPVAYLIDFSTINTADPDSEVKNYTFVCFPNEAKLSAEGHVHDYYAEAQKVVGMANAVNPFLPIMCIISFILACVCLVIFLKAAGHTRQSDEIVAGPIDKIPIEALVFGGAILELLFAVIIDRLSYKESAALWICSIVIDLVLNIVMLLIFCSIVAVNIKLHKLRENSVILGLLMKIDWKKRIWIVYVAVPMFLFMITLFLYRIFNAGSDEKVLAAFLGVFMDKAVLAVFIFWGIRSYSKIKDAAEKLANGDTTARVDVAGMPQFFEDTGNAINEIQSGFEIALAEQTKSERMRTELITNVSHDIKTPITSIINYVDLLGKENIESEKVNEYLEVLNRQSLRLKKLVEDIIEAAKITTGNINLNMEEVDAKVLLDQSIGEFAERLKEKQIEVVVSSSEEKMMLLADNRYLWRVFDNIMSNIVKYAKADTRAYVDLKKEDDKLRFIFRNTSREQLNITPDELMERFVRGDKSRYTDGNGLGLSIASSLTKAMGGSMNLTIDGDFFKVILEFDVIDKSEG